MPAIEKAARSIWKNDPLRKSRSDARKLRLLRASVHLETDFLSYKMPYSAISIAEEMLVIADKEEISSIIL
jgi:hypothetical protein